MTVPRVILQPRRARPLRLARRVLRRPGLHRRALLPRHRRALHELRRLRHRRLPRRRVLRPAGGALVGQIDQAQAHYAQALAAAAFDDPDDQVLFKRLYPRP